MSDTKNRLAEEASPYLLQHADNPVHWWPWGDEALAEAKQRNVPILLSIGYAACHWCHVMAHECFEDEEVAAAMNAGFVNVKVDREERPDVDALYMAALHALGEQGGWPLTMFINAEGAPIWGGTYFPKHSKFGRPGFLDVLAAVRKTWDEDPKRIAHNTGLLLDHLRTQNTQSSSSDAKPPDIPAFVDRLFEMQDPINGGLQGAPKFPNAPILDTLWNGWTIHGSNKAMEAFLTTLHALCKGGIYDHIGGGLARYCVDAQWLVPHFEKMLYDNAHFIRHLTWAFRATGDPLFRVRIEETINWLSLEMTGREGAFFSSLDADSEGEEGKFYVWSKAEIDDVLGDDAEAFCAFYDISQKGNWEGSSIPNLLEQPSKNLGNAQEKFGKQRETLFAARSKRIRPGLDDKILTDWNGYLIEALAGAAIALDQPGWLENAKAAFRFFSESNWKEKGLFHSFRGEKYVRPGMLTDYAAMANAALALFEASGEEIYLTEAQDFTQFAVDHYGTESGGFYLTPVSATDLPVRTLAHNDEANPSGASELIRALSRLSALSGNHQFHQAADRTINALSQHFDEARHGQAGFYSAYDWFARGQTVVIVGNKTDAKSWLDTLVENPRAARSVQRVSTLADLPDDHYAKAASVSSTPAALICENQSCSLPITDLNEFRTAIRNEA